MSYHDFVRQRLADLYPMYPRPLALAYRNLDENYTSFRLNDGERTAVGSTLVSQLIQHYFPKEDYHIHKLRRQHEPAIACIPTRGTTWRAVIASSRGQSDDGMVDEDHEMTGSDDYSGVDRVQLLFGVVSSPRFADLDDRKKPSIIPFGSNATGFVLNGKRVRRGNVVLLTPNPGATRPAFEFYTFDLDSEGPYLLPYFGHTLRDELIDGMKSNSLTLERNDTVAVDEMFRKLEACEPETFSLTPMFVSEEAATSTSSDEEEGESVQLVRFNKAGRPIGLDGRLLPINKAQQSMSREAPRPEDLKSSNGLKDPTYVVARSYTENNTSSSDGDGNWEGTDDDEEPRGRAVGQYSLRRQTRATEREKARRRGEY